MKKLLLLVAALALVGTSSAQKVDKSIKTFTFGPKVGLNLADVAVVGMGQSGGVKADFQVGGFVEYRICNWFAVSADLLCSRQGSSVEGSEPALGGGADAIVKEVLTLQYLNVPVLANFYVAKGLALKTGLEPGFLLGAKFKQTINDRYSTVDLHLNATP